MTQIEKMIYEMLDEEGIHYPDGHKILLLAGRSPSSYSSIHFVDTYNPTEIYNVFLLYDDIAMPFALKTPEDLTRNRFLMSERWVYEYGEISYSYDVDVFDISIMDDYVEVWNDWVNKKYKIKLLESKI